MKENKQKKILPSLRRGSRLSFYNVEDCQIFIAEQRKYQKKKKKKKKDSTGMVQRCALNNRV